MALGGSLRTREAAEPRGFLAVAVTWPRGPRKDADLAPFNALNNAARQGPTCATAWPPTDPPMAATPPDAANPMPARRQPFVHAPVRQLDDGTAC